MNATMVEKLKGCACRRMTSLPWANDEVTFQTDMTKMRDSENRTKEENLQTDKKSTAEINFDYVLDSPSNNTTDLVHNVQLDKMGNDCKQTSKRSKILDKELVSNIHKHLLYLSTIVLNHTENKEISAVSEEQCIAIKNETEYLRRRKHYVPKKLNEQMLKEIVIYGGQNITSRTKLYRELAECENKKDKVMLNRLDKAEQKRLLLKQLLFHYKTGEDKDSENLLSDSFVRKLVFDYVKPNLMFGFNFGQPLVIDLGLPYKMEGKEVVSFYSQMKEIYFYNSIQWEPHNIFMCNYAEDDEVMSGLVNKFDGFLWNVTSKCFTQLFPHDKLVYLSPDSPHIMKDFSHDDIFVLGACVDQKTPTLVSYEKVKKLGIRSARLDVDTYFALTRKHYRTKRQSRELNPFFAISDVFAVLLDARETEGHWDYAHRNLVKGRKKVLEWKPEHENLEKKFQDLRFQTIVQNLKSQNRG